MTFSIGEGFAGEGVERGAREHDARREERSGRRGVGDRARHPRAGHAAFVVVAAPNVPVKPMTLFVNKATVDDANERHARLTWGAAQAGVAAGVIDAHRKGVLRAEDADDLVLVAAVWVNPAADDEEAVYANNARGDARRARPPGRDDLPSIGTVLDVGEPRNPYFRA